jgi:cold shock CspA family protein
LIEGETVSFTPVENVKGMKAEDVQIIEVDGNQ